MAENEEMTTKKVSELPVSSSFKGLYTLGVDSSGKSVKVSLESVGTATEAANTAATTANTAAANVKNGTDGKTPIIAIGTVSGGETAGATMTADGTDTSGNPKYKLDLTLPKGAQGTPGTPGYDGSDGKTPIIAIGTITTVASTEQAAASLESDGVDASGNPKYRLNLSIPRGQQGASGSGSGNVSANGDGLVATKKYLFTPSSDGSTEGVFVEYTEPKYALSDKVGGDAKALRDFSGATAIGGIIAFVGGLTYSNEILTNDESVSDYIPVFFDNSVPTIQPMHKTEFLKLLGFALGTDEKPAVPSIPKRRLWGNDFDGTKDIDGALSIKPGTHGGVITIDDSNGYEGGGINSQSYGGDAGKRVVLIYAGNSGQQKEKGLALYDNGKARFNVGTSEQDYSVAPTEEVDINGALGGVSKVVFTDGTTVAGTVIKKRLLLEQATSGAVTLAADKHIVISGQTTITVSLPANPTYVEEYNLEIQTGTTAPTVTFPSTLKWDGGVAPTFDANKTYQIVIFNNIGYCSQGAS